MARQFQEGDQVQWQSGGGTTSGTVEKKITEATEVEGKKIDASPDDPRYLVKNDSTGKVTSHKPDTLSLAKDSDHQKSSQNSHSQFAAGEREEYIKEFQEAVNMTSKELQEWLQTKESKSVGQKDDDGEAIGHKSGKQIVEILDKNKSDYTDDDIDHMKRVVSYVHRHLAQKPSGDLENSPWRYSLMNWGNDPLK